MFYILNHQQIAKRNGKSNHYSIIFKQSIFIFSYKYIRRPHSEKLHFSFEYHKVQICSYLKLYSFNAIMILPCNVDNYVCEINSWNTSSYRLMYRNCYHPFKNEVILTEVNITIS